MGGINSGSPAAAARSAVTSRTMWGALFLLVVTLTFKVDAASGEEPKTVDAKVPKLLKNVLRKKLGDTPDVNGSGWTAREKRQLEDFSKKARNAHSMAIGGGAGLGASVAGYWLASHIANKRATAALRQGNLDSPALREGHKFRWLMYALIAGFIASLGIFSKGLKKSVSMRKKFKALAEEVKENRAEEGEAAGSQDEPSDGLTAAEHIT